MNEQINILIADDDTNLTETLSDILEERGYNVVTVDSGEKAVAEVQSRRFD